MQTSMLIPGCSFIVAGFVASDNEPCLALDVSVYTCCCTGSVTSFVPSCSGTPPTWACKPTFCLQDVAERAAAAYGDGVDLAAVKSWRRKLIKHHDSVRPAYYGSWRKPR